MQKIALLSLMVFGAASASDQGGQQQGGQQHNPPVQENLPVPGTLHEKIPSDLVPIIKQYANAAPEALKQELASAKSLSELQKIVSQNGASRSFSGALDLSRFSNDVTNDTLKMVSEFLPKIEMLNLEGSTQITDEGLGYLTNLKNLKTLNLMDCHKITKLGLDYLKKIENLSKLNLIGTKMTRPELRPFYQTYRSKINIQPDLSRRAIDIYGADEPYLE